ncbi:MAG TPA: hypothetical protein VNS52_17545 [Gemmatimonadaceae bacterium]|nr:hypothetical protein [Gemmatimonadaceae bacterium]
MTDLARRRPRAALTAVASLVAVLAASACIRGTLPARQYFRLSMPDSVAAATRDSATVALATGTLGIAEYVTPGIYAGGGIAYRIGESEYGTYPSREWAIPLGQMLGVLTEGVLRRAPLTASPAIFNPPSLRSQTYVWRGTVREFEEVDRGRAVSAAVRIDASLVRSSDDSVVWSGSARREGAVPAPTMDAVVGTLSSLATETITALVAEADSALRRQAPSAASARGHE